MTSAGPPIRPATIPGIKRFPKTTPRFYTRRRMGALGLARDRCRFNDFSVERQVSDITGGVGSKKGEVKIPLFTHLTLCK